MLTLHTATLTLLNFFILLLIKYRTYIVIKIVTRLLSMVFGICLVMLGYQTLKSFSLILTITEFKSPNVKVSISNMSFCARVRCSCSYE